jgi:hypothetical protein
LLIGHSCYRGVYERLRDLFHGTRSLGYIHTVSRAAMDRARILNQQQDLSGVGLGAHDEIFQTRQPVLVGVDVASTYCYLLSREKQRDGVPWGVRLLELQAHGFAPAALIGDGASGVQAGQDLALPHIPRRGDVFHVLHEVTPLVSFLENRAYPVLPQPPALPPERASPARAPEPGGTADRPGARPLAGTPRLAGPLGQLTTDPRRSGKQGTRNSPSGRGRRKSVLLPKNDRC